MVLFDSLTHKTIMMICQLELDIMSKLDFNGGRFEKWPKPIFRSNLFLVTSLTDTGPWTTIAGTDTVVY